MNVLTKKSFFSLVILASLLPGVLAGKDVWKKSTRLREGIQYLEMTLEVPRASVLSDEQLAKMRDTFNQKATAKKFDLSYAKNIKPDVRPMKIYAMRIDLKLSGLCFTGTGRTQGWGNPMPADAGQQIRTYRITTADFMKECRDNRHLNLVVAMNSAPWLPWPPPKGDTRHANPAGINVSDGVLISDNGDFASAFFVVRKNGKVDIVDKIDRKKLDEYFLVSSGFGIIMKNGEKTGQTATGYDEGLMPRMTYGLDRNRRYLYVVAIDGRQPGWSEGATGNDLFKLFKQLGASDVIDMDGGGSATLCFWDRQKKAPRIFNMHEYNPKYYRPVGMNMGIYLKR